ncbi:unnamed protein product [Cladocopium goreaui]|uniref:Uncharacterized protein n=1 Tax=Cladocopium goreaui TaxID=2562237 RepID=A0A9P1BUA2_9DINO|nr:unnamed protein product [Cladocopium goreaui]
MDLRYLDNCSNEEHSKLQRDTNQLMARSLGFGLLSSRLKAPARGLLLPSTNGGSLQGPLVRYFFVPGVDLGLVYSPMQMALMKARDPGTLGGQMWKWLDFHNIAIEWVGKIL